MAVKRLDDLEQHDFVAAADYLSMLTDENTAIPCRLVSWVHTA
ncbi:hypothetical protein ACQ86B_00745 [Mycolicibacterium aichiense]